VEGNKAAAKGGTQNPGLPYRPQAPPSKKNEGKGKEKTVEGSMQSGGESHQTEPTTGVSDYRPELDTDYRPEALTDIYWPEALGPMPISEFYVQDNKIWRDPKLGYKSKEVNGNLSITDVQEYARKHPPHKRMPHGQPENFVPYSSVMDFVWTMRKASEEGSAFEWPSESITCSKAIATAIHHLPPGCAVSIKNAKKLPDWAVKKRSAKEAKSKRESHQTEPQDKGGKGWWTSEWWWKGPRAWWDSAKGWWGAEGGAGTAAASSSTSWHGEEVVLSVEEAAEMEDELWDNILDYYHGSYAELAPSSLRDGLLPCMGAGADALAAWFGMEVPGVYVAKAFEVASGYPNECTTGYTTLKQWVGTQWECESTYKDGVPGGTVVADDATPPLRVV